MAKRYDPIMCMLVDEPTKAQDELSLAQKKQVVIELKGFLKKSYNFSDESEYARAYEDLRRMFTIGSRKSISGLFENTVKKTGAHDVKARDVAPATQRYINTIVDESKANAEKFVRQAEQDAGFVLRYKNGQYMSSAGRTNEKAKAKVFSSKREAEAYKGDYVVSSTDPDYHNWSVVAVDSASALDKAISTCDASSGDAMKQIASTAKAWAKQYNQLFEKATTAEEVKKLKSQKDNDYRRAMDNLDKIYNEVSQAYGRARSEVRDLFDEVDSNGFKAYQRVTQK